MAEIILALMGILVGLYSGFYAIRLFAYLYVGTPHQIPFWLPFLHTLIAVTGIGAGAISLFA